MIIEEFVEKSIGEWRSMRSGHSLAFRQFEEVLSNIVIQEVETDNQLLLELYSAKHLRLEGLSPVKPFYMKWEAESDWNDDDRSENLSGSCIIIPYPVNLESGLLLRSVGYAETEQALSTYSFLDDGTFILKTIYNQSIAEERIWFISENIRCRSSVLRTSEGSGVLQTSFASELRIPKKYNDQK